MPDIQRVSTTEIQWMDEDGKHHSVRYFPQLGTLIWSSWFERPDALAFDDGIRQQVSDFIERGAPQALNVPDTVRAEVHSMVNPPKMATDSAKRRGFFGWLRRK